MMRSVPEGQRAARFVCSMCLATPEGNVLARSRGVFEGDIVLEPRGSNGFGYDPHLRVRGEDRTSAELSPDEKNSRSHRGAATRMMAALIQDKFGNNLKHSI